MRADDQLACTRRLVVDDCRLQTAVGSNAIVRSSCRYDTQQAAAVRENGAARRSSKGIDVCEKAVSIELKRPTTIVDLEGDPSPMVESYYMCSDVHAGVT